MGLGRWTLELELAQDATEKRKLLEAEKEVTPDLIEKYKAQAEKERSMAETLTSMLRSFYCELCDRQYTKYSEYDNHINSYSHHHNQRLKDLKQYEAGRKFGGNPEALQLQRDKMAAAQVIAVERAQMKAKRNSKYYRTAAPGFKPIGGDSTNQSTTIVAKQPEATPTHQASGFKRLAESELKIAEKKARLSKFGLKFQSAGTLVTIGNQMKETKHSPQETQTSKTSLESKSDVSQSSTSSRQEEDSTKTASDEKKLSFGFNKNPIAKSSQFGSGGSSQKGPPPLMSRQRELTLSRAFKGDEEEEGNEQGFTHSVLSRPPPKFKFKLGK